MNVLIWLLRAALFIVLFGLAIKNSGPVELRFFLEQSWQLPLSFVLLATLVAGIVLGMLAASSTVIHQRKELGRLKSELQAHGQEGKKAAP